MCKSSPNLFSMLCNPCSFEPDEYEELTARPDMEGKLKDIEEGIDDASEFIEEASKSAPPIKKAAGGLAYMLGE